MSSTIQTSIVKKPRIRQRCCGMWMTIARSDPLVLRCLACDNEVEPHDD